MYVGSGNPNWLTTLLDPPLPLQDHNPMASDIVASLERPSLNAAKWLLRAGAKVNVVDSGGASPLHHASYGGLLGLVRLLLTHGADTFVRNEDNRTAIHLALANGHAELAYVLYQAGSDLYLPDKHGVLSR
jgi:ankyrin repeat protein